MRSLFYVFISFALFACAGSYQPKTAAGAACKKQCANTGSSCVGSTMGCAAAYTECTDACADLERFDAKDDAPKEEQEKPCEPWQACSDKKPTTPVKTVPTVVETRTDAHEAAEDPSASALCVNAFAHIEDLTDQWIKTHGGTARDDLASKERFMDMCGRLPESMQLCLNLKYLNAHAGQCDVAYTKLPEAQQQRLNRLFVRK